ncbi:MAG: IS66 family insertion sequence element accessory protein TnpB [Chthoniobacteraceae bacterium]
MLRRRCWRRNFCGRWWPEAGGVEFCRQPAGLFLAVEPCDMRKGFEGLHSLVGERLREDVRSGGLFVFINKRRTRLKALYFDCSSLWVINKRLEQGTFAWPQAEEIGAPPLLPRAEAFAMLTDGIDLRGAKIRPWYERGPGKNAPASKRKLT